MTGRELVRRAREHDRRARPAWRSPALVAAAAGGALAALVQWRLATGGELAATHVWLAAALVAFALAALRVPFHLYWRADAALLAQLPIEGDALVAAALARSYAAALGLGAALVLAAAPLAVEDFDLAARAAAFAGVLAIAAGALLPAVALYAAMLVASGKQPPGSAGAVLGALPGFAATAVIVAIMLAARWLTGRVAAIAVAPELGAVVGASVVGLAVARATAPRLMGTILRDVSALDRQRLAHLDIKPPTALERGIAALLGDGALPYRKDARLVRRRYPMAYALGALAFAVLAIVGVSRPADPAPWLVGTLAAGALYAGALAGRLRRPPIELPRLSATLPISAAARARAKTAWLVAWIALYLAIPAAFAIVRAY